MDILEHCHVEMESSRQLVCKLQLTRKLDFDAGERGQEVGRVCNSLIDYISLPVFSAKKIQLFRSAFNIFYEQIQSELSPSGKVILFHSSTVLLFGLQKDYFF